MVVEYFKQKPEIKDPFCLMTFVVPYNHKRRNAIIRISTIEKQINARTKIVHKKIALLRILGHGPVNVLNKNGVKIGDDCGPAIGDDI